MFMMMEAQRRFSPRVRSTTKKGIYIPLKPYLKQEADLEQPTL